MTLPSHCARCGVPLFGGATKHKPDCAIQKLIDENFPKPQNKMTLPTPKEIEAAYDQITIDGPFKEDPSNPTYQLSLLTVKNEYLLASLRRWVQVSAEITRSPEHRGHEHLMGIFTGILSFGLHLGLHIGESRSGSIPAPDTRDRRIAAALELLHAYVPPNTIDPTFTPEFPLMQVKDFSRFRDLLMVTLRNE